MTSLSNPNDFGPIIKRKAVADADYTVLNTDYLIAFTSLTITRTLTLPTPDGKIRVFEIKDESGNSAAYPIVINPLGLVTIDGVLSIQITVPYGSLEIYSDGANYFTKGGG